MKIATMATGGVGGYFGARLAAAGHDVTFIARGEHGDAIRKDGLKVESVHGDMLIKPAKVSAHPADVGPVDVVLFAVKLWDTESAAELCKPMIGPDTRVITLQNGVDSYERIAPIVGARNAVPGVTYVVSTIAAPGVIKQTGRYHSIVCGPTDGKPDAPLEKFVKEAKAAGVDITLSNDIQRVRWEKFVFLTATSGVTSVTRQTMGPILADPDMRTLFRSVMAETAAVARAEGASVAQDFPDERLAFADANVPHGMKASMANDLDRGNRLELDWLAGRVVALGKKHGVPTPVNAAVYAALKPFRMGTR